jgi:hypothetical protein
MEMLQFIIYNIVRVVNALLALSIGMLFKEYNTIAFYNMVAAIALVTSIEALVLYTRASSAHA